MRPVLGFLQLLGVALLVCALVAGAVVGGVFLTHGRDEVAYLRYVHQNDGEVGLTADVKGSKTAGRAASGSGQQTTTAPVTLADSDLVSAGDAACDWLQHRPPALWHDDAAHEISTMVPEYAATMDVKDKTLRTAIVSGAWAHLCPATRVLVSPHRPWER